MLYGEVPEVALRLIRSAVSSTEESLSTVDVEVATVAASACFPVRSQRLLMVADTISRFMATQAAAVVEPLAHPAEQTAATDQTATREPVALVVAEAEATKGQPRLQRPPEAAAMAGFLVAEVAEAGLPTRLEESVTQAFPGQAATEPVGASS